MEKVLLILESEVTQKMLRNSLSEYDVKISDPDEAKLILTQFQPDAMILDLALPGTTGIAVSEECRDVMPPVVIALSVLPADYVQKQTEDIGVGFVISKPCTMGYVEKRLTDMLLMQRIPELTDNGDIVDKLLEQIPIHGRPRALLTLRTAVLQVLQDPDCALTKHIYPVSCKVYGGSTNAVDQAFRRMIRNSWKHKNQNPKIWDTLFPGYTEQPSNSDFIFTVAKYLRTAYPSRFPVKP